MEIMRKVIEGDGEGRSKNAPRAPGSDKEMGCDQGMARARRALEVP